MADTYKDGDPIPTFRAVLATGETVDYQGAHPTHWSFGGVDPNTGKADGSPVRVVPVLSVHPVEAFPAPTGNGKADK